MPPALPACIAVCHGAYVACAAGALLLGPFAIAGEIACGVTMVACNGACIAGCFHPSTKIRIGDGLNIDVSQLQVNQEIVAISPDDSFSSTNIMKSKVTLVEVMDGEFHFIEFSFENHNNTLSVTLDHIVIANSKVVTAGDVKLQDSMMLVDEFGMTDVKVINIRQFVDYQKVNIESSDGVAIANGILTTIICDGYKEEIGSDVGTFFEKYVQTHIEFFSTNENATFFEKYKKQINIL